MGKRTTKRSKKIIKVIYFDEGSATDFIYIVEGGKSEDQTKEIVEKTSELAAKTEAKATAKFGLLPFLKASAGAEAEASFQREGNTIISKALVNTILTDYLKTVEESTNSFYVTRFTDSVLYPYPESFSYYKMITPYLVMTEGKVDLGSDIKLNIALMDQALESGRGYYELIAEKDGIKSVLRLNIKAFRNNYSISDLIKMSLDFHAIEVGRISEKNLTMQSEFNPSTGEISGYDVVAGIEKSNDLKVYDVILAGVSK